MRPPSLSVALLALVALSCTGKKKNDDAPASGEHAQALASRVPFRTSAPKIAPNLDLIDELPRCEIDHGGVVVDFGGPSVYGVVGPWSLGNESLFDTERDGETWAKVMSRRLMLRLIVDEPEPMFFEMRARGGVARSASLSLDGRPLGTVSLTRGQSRVVSTRATAIPVSAGSHALELRFSGAVRAQAEPFAELDWVRAGTQGDENRTYAPPTLNQVVTNASLGGVPHRSLALRTPSAVRCTTYVPEAARLQVAVGYEGQGEAEATIQVFRDGERPAAVYTATQKGGEQATFQNVDVPLDDFAGRIATIQFEAKGKVFSGRLLFGDPVVAVDARPPPEMSKARLAMIVMMSGLDRTKTASQEICPTLSDLSRTATTFESHRQPTTVTAGIMATLLAGVSPRVHGVEDPGARLSAGLVTIGAAARDGSVQTAMFTGCPTTSEAFGFARGWDKYLATSPVEGAPATAPIDEAARWTLDHLKSTESRALVVVHARGGHPPWDVTNNEAAKMPPSEYTGPIEPRRSAEVIARARVKHSRFRLTENDRTRLFAIYDAALAGQDRALGQLVDSLKKAGIWDETLLVVTGDTSINNEGRAPFGDAEDLTEQTLKVPLWVHFPGGQLAGTKVSLPTALTDLSRTALDALRLRVPDGFEGFDLFAIASGKERPGGRPQLATLGSRYSMRLGEMILSGIPGKTPSLCDAASDPGCDIDRLEKMPRTAGLLFRMTYDAEAAAQKVRRAREPATIDANTAAALEVWGE